MKKVKNFIDEKMIEAQVKLAKMAEGFLSEERGDTNFVSIMIIIVIVLAVAAIFRTQLIAIVTNVMQQVTDFTNGGGE